MSSRNIVSSRSGTRTREQQRVARGVLSCPIDDLTAADVGREKLRSAPNHVETDDRAAGETEQRELARTWSRARASSTTRKPSSTSRATVVASAPDFANVKPAARLIPLHERELAFPVGKERREGREAGARPADEQQRGIASIGPAQREPLGHAVDVYECAVVDGLHGSLPLYCAALAARQTKRPPPECGGGPETLLNSEPIVSARRTERQALTSAKRLALARTAAARYSVRPAPPPYLSMLSA